jgi:transglutaminase-like putative cysteine protease
MTTTIDLQPYTAKGFPGDFDRGIAEVQVAGIDRDQAQSMVRLCAETEEALYEDGFSPTRIHYRKGSRPQLEAIAATLEGTTPREKAFAAMRWVATNVKHPHITGPTAPDRNFTEEQLVDSCRGWCNEQTRVFVALCEVMEIPARLNFVFHVNEVCGHTCAEVYLDGRWVFFDITFQVVVELPNGQLAEGRDLCGDKCSLAHETYRKPFEDYFAKVQSWVENEPGWNSRQRPKAEAGGDLLAYMGICNYIIDGVEAV